jgi:hypothetical protein
MDALTPRGLTAIAHSRRCIDIMRSNYPSLSFLETDQELPADVDGLVVEGVIIRSVFEIKARSFSLAEFRAKHDSQWLVTFDKLLRAQALARSLCCAVTGYIYFIPDDAVMVARIFDATGNISSPFTVRQTTTQATVNGGEACRGNAYVDLRKSPILHQP